jgi:hypothetical protein
MRRIFRNLIAGNGSNYGSVVRRQVKTRHTRLAVLHMEDRIVPTITYPVTVASPDDGTTAGTLRAAIAAANADGDDSVIDFQFAGDTTITLALGQMLITEDSVAAGKTVSFTRSGTGKVTIDGAGLGGIFAVDAGYTGPTFKMSDITLTNGKTAGDGGGLINNSTTTVTTLTNVNITNCEADNKAGGGAVFSATTNLTNCNITGNKVVAVAKAYGGGVLCAVAGKLTVVNSNISGNTATGAGTNFAYGGNVEAGGDMTASGSTFNNGKTNTGKGIGSGVYCGGILNLSGSSITGNSGGYLGGGIYAYGTNITISSCTINSNSSSQAGGGIWWANPAVTTFMMTDSTLDGNSCGGAGGAMRRGAAVTGETSTFERDTFSNNVSGNSGGVLAISGAGTGTVVFDNSTFFNNVCAGNGGVVRTFGSFGGTIRIDNSTVVGNVAPGAGAVNVGGVAGAILDVESSVFFNNKAGGTVNSTVADVQKLTTDTATIDHTYLSVGVPAGFTFSGGNNKFGTAAAPINPQLQPFANYGGVTKTLLPSSSSVDLINKGSNPLGLTTDQRNDNITFPRSFNGGVDIGAVEFNNPVPTVTGFSASDATAPGATPNTFTITFTTAVPGRNINATSLSTAGAITISGGAFGSPVNATLVGSYSNSPSITATYSFTPPGGSWVFADNGTYTVTVNANKIFDDTPGTPLAVPAGAAGTFKCAIGASILVNATNDEAVDTDGLTSLREALILANSPAYTGKDTITFDPTVFAGTQTVTLDATLGRMTISDSVVINGPAGHVVLDASVSASQIFLINGPGTLSVSIDKVDFSNGKIVTTAFGDNGGAVRIADENVTFSNCVFTGNSAALDGGAIGQNGIGNLTITNCTFTTNASTGAGGGAVAMIGGGTLTMSGSTLSSNTAVGVGGAVETLNNTATSISNSTVSMNQVTGDSQGGGGIAVAGATTTTINGSTISTNEVTNLAGGGVGGGLAVFGAGNVTINNSVISANKVDLGPGGGIWLRDDVASLTVNNSTLDSNMALGSSTFSQSGGAGIRAGGSSTVSMTFTTVTVNSSTISNNSTDQSGGGIKMDLGGLLIVSNSTLAGNTAGIDGGGILLNAQGQANVVRNSTVAFNNAGGATVGGGGIAITGAPTGGGALTLSSTIVAKNTNALAADVGADAATSIAGNNNLVQANTTGSITYTGTNPQNGLDPSLNPTLALNGAPAGTPFTLALNAGSPAINNGNNAAGLMFDERGSGFNRTSGGGTDIGAFEIQAAASPPTVTNLKIDDGTIQRSMITSLTITFSEAVTFTGAIANAFLLNRNSAPAPGPGAEQGGVTGLVNLSAVQVGNVVTLTFNTSGANPIDGVGGGVGNGVSLPDGRYTLTIDASQVMGVGGKLDGNGDGTGGDNYVLASAPAPAAPTNIFRFFGDVTGDGAVTAADFNGTGPLGTPPNVVGFKQGFGGTDHRLDYNGDGSVASSDFTQFRFRFGGTVP